MKDRDSALVEPLRPETGRLLFGSGKPRGRWIYPEGFWDVVPEFRAQQIQPPTVPGAPFIPGGPIKNDHARHCAAWLGAWVEVNFGERPPYSSRTRYEQRRNWRALCEGIAFLQKHRCSAARWVSFYGRLHQQSGQLAPPAVSRVFSRGVVQKYLQDAARQIPPLGGRVIRLPRATKLAHKHARMMQALMVERPSDIPGVRAVVARYFPGGKFRNEVVRLIAEGDAERQRLEKAIARHTWIW